MKKPNFIPPAQILRRLRQQPAVDFFTYGLERNDGCVFRFEIPLPAGAAEDPLVVTLCERAVKFGLWSAGGWRLYLAGPAHICDFVEKTYAPGGKHQFDRDMMRIDFDNELEFVRCKREEVPAFRDAQNRTRISFEGCRIGFDLGASDYKIAAVKDGEVLFNDEFPWDPVPQTDPNYHFNHLNDGLKKAAATLPRVDAIGGSSAGSVIDNRLRIASLTRSVAGAENIKVAQDIFQRVEREWKVPVEVVNDGDATALAAHITNDYVAVLGIAMGSSQASGYLDRSASLTGRLTELAFCPVDLSPDALADEWSGDKGVGALYFSQQAVNRLANFYDLGLDQSVGLPARLVEVQERMKAGDKSVEIIYELIGEYLGHSAVWYREFYDFDNMLILGRVTTGRGGDIILEKARATLAEYYPDTAIQIVMPDEKAKRLGQSVAAAAISR